MDPVDVRLEVVDGVEGLGAAAALELFDGVVDVALVLAERGQGGELLVARDGVAVAAKDDAPVRPQVAVEGVVTVEGARTSRALKLDILIAASATSNWTH